MDISTRAIREREEQMHASRSTGWVPLVLGVSLSAQGAEIAAPSQFQPVRQYIQAAIEEKRSPSVAVAVVMEERVVWAEGFGLAQLESNRRATANSIYRLASISKPMTATGLMILLDRGLIDLDAPANRYLKGARLDAHAGSPDAMTIRRIANHTSGLPLHYSFYYNGVDPPPRTETIRRYGFAFTKPGAAFQYSNLGYGVLDYILESISGSSWREFMEQNVYDPLDMTRTTAGVRNGREADATGQYTKDLAGRFVKVGTYEFDHPGASAVWSSALDMVRFAQMHLNGGTLDGQRLLKKETVAQMQVPTGKRPGRGGYGIGWSIGPYHGRHCVSHSGGMPGVSTMLRLYPRERAATVVLLNCDSRPLTGAITSRIADVLFPREPVPKSNKSETKDIRKQSSTPSSTGTRTQAKPLQTTSGHLMGSWKGRLAHFDGSVPVHLVVAGPQTATIQFGTQGRRPLKINSSNPDMLVAHTDVKLRTQPSFHGVVKLELQLRRKEDRLTGAGVVTAAGYFALSHWIELKQE